jgi:hypothetical protein
MRIKRSIDQLDRLVGLKSGIKVTRAIRGKAKIAISDIKSGKIHKDDESMKNLIDTVNDILKASVLGTGYILIPGSLILMPIIRKSLDRSKILGIKNLLRLTVENEIKGDEDKEV